MIIMMYDYKESCQVFSGNSHFIVFTMKTHFEKYTLLKKSDFSSSGMNNLFMSVYLKDKGAQI